MTRTQRQIEGTRMRDAAIVVCGRDGRPRAGLCVSIEQTAHEFPFGCLAAEQREFPESERRRYAARVSEVFNTTVSAEWLEARDPRGVLDVSREPLHLGRLRRRLDRLAETGGAWVVVSGRTVSPTRESAPADRACERNDRLEPVTTSDERRFACRVAELFTLCFSYPAVSGLVWRGFCEREPEVPPGLGLLRSDLAPPHAHRVLRKLIGTDWHTRQTGTTASDGRFAFRGFCGDYRVVVTPEPGAPAAAIAHVRLSREIGASHEFELHAPS